VQKVRTQTTMPANKHDNHEIVGSDWYQQFNLPGGQTASGRFDRTETCDLVFPRDMTGKTVLDVGTREGMFCFEALKRGARRAVGLEIFAEFVSRARKLAEILDLPAEFQQVDVDKQCPTEAFDDVLCLNLLHHVRDPFLLLERLIDLTRERLILEVAGMGSHEQKKLKLNWWRRLLFRGLRGLPVVFVNPNSLRRNRQKFYLSVDAVHCLLTEHRLVFSKVEVIPSPFKDRHILIAHKRRINHLIVVAGATSAGKTTLIDNLSRGQAPDVIDHLGIKDIKAWETLDTYDIAKDDRTELPYVIMHYDFLSRLKWNFEHSQMIEFLDIVRSAQNVTFLTIWTDPAQLREQFEENEIREHVRQHGTETKNKKTLRLREDYKDPQTIINYYKSWFEFASTLSLKHVVLSQTPVRRFLSVDEWQRECE